MNDMILTVGEVAILVHEHKRTIERKAKSGFYPPNVCGKHGRTWLFNKEELLKFIFC